MAGGRARKRPRRTLSINNANDETELLEKREPGLEERTTHDFVNAAQAQSAEAVMASPLVILKFNTMSGVPMEWPLMEKIVKRFGVYEEQLATAVEQPSPHKHFVIRDEVQRDPNHMLELFAFLMNGTIPVGSSVLGNVALAHGLWKLCETAAGMEVDGFVEAALPRLVDIWKGMSLDDFHESAKYICRFARKMEVRVGSLLGEAIVKELEERLGQPESSGR